MNSVKPISNWGMNFSDPVLITGPCSVESEEQVMQTVVELGKTNKVDLVRGGIWKPRTRPNSFEGIGEVGLKWLKAAGNAINKPVTCEVANAVHVYQCIRHQIDVLWIGARTSVNPFAVQEIADALNGIDIPVMIKNPINADLSLWLGAVERIRNAGIERVAVIHRGFSAYHHSKFRNLPRWEIPIAFKRAMPDVPLICDPSHICGKRDLLLEVSQKAIDLDFDGLMIESHINPDKALSDAKQQVTPMDYQKLIESIVDRNPDVTSADLEKLRDEIDGVDREIIDILAKRMKIAEEIGSYKKQNNITILQSERWNNIVKDREGQGKEKGLTSEFMLELYQSIHKESIRHQSKVMN